MKGKYKSRLHYAAAFGYRCVVRLLVRTLLAWDRRPQWLDDGCSVIIGMCSRLPQVLPANVRCIAQASWPGLKEIIIGVDNRAGCLSRDFEENVARMCPHIPVRFVYYSFLQYHVAEFLKLPYLFSWLSWCLAIKACRTKVFFIQDYDALVFGKSLRERYKRFIDSGFLMQGVFLYGTHGITREDKMVSSLQVFIDTAWIRAYPPIMIFNRVGRLNGKTVDFDTLLYLQSLHCPAARREVVDVTDEDLIHPHQMIHQYTVFRKFPGRPWYCAALTMIPFFYYLSGNTSIFKDACRRLEATQNKAVDLLNDGCLMNFEWLTVKDINRLFGLMIQGFINSGIEPFDDFYDYTQAFYRLLNVPASDRWKMASTPAQMQWVNRLRGLSKEGSEASPSQRV